MKEYEETTRQNEENTMRKKTREKYQKLRPVRLNILRWFIIVEGAGNWLAFDDIIEAVNSVHLE